MNKIQKVISIITTFIITLMVLTLKLGMVFNSCSVLNNCNGIIVRGELQLQTTPPRFQGTSPLQAHIYRIFVRIPRCISDTGLRTTDDNIRIRLKIAKNILVESPSTFLSKTA
jgi:hypothetical protein